MDWRLKSPATCPSLVQGAWKPVERSRQGLPLCLSFTQNPSAVLGPTVGWLVALSGLHRGEDFRVCSGVTVIGAAWDSDIVVTCPLFSSRQARISCQNSHTWVEDLASKQTTQLNGEVVTRAELFDGDELMLGATRFVWRLARRFEPGTQLVLRPRPTTPPPTNTVERCFVAGWLVAKTGEFTGRDFRLLGGENRVGRRRGIEVSLVGSSIADLHACIEFQRGAFRVRRLALGSALMVDGHEVGVEPVAISESDVLRLGTEEFYLKCL